MCQVYDWQSGPLRDCCIGAFTDHSARESTDIPIGGTSQQPDRTDERRRDEMIDMALAERKGLQRCCSNGHSGPIDNRRIPRQFHG